MKTAKTPSPYLDPASQDKAWADWADAPPPLFVVGRREHRARVSDNIARLKDLARWDSYVFFDNNNTRWPFT